MSEGYRDSQKCKVHAGKTWLSHEGGRTDGRENEDGIRCYLEGTRALALRRVRSGAGDGSGCSGARVCSLLGLLNRVGQGSHEDVVTQEEAWWLDCGEELGGPACFGEVWSAVSGFGRPQGLFPSDMTALHLRLVRGAGCPVLGVYILDISLPSYL